MELTKIQKLLQFIEGNYHRIIEPKELEHISNYSYRNTQRIFQNIYNETLGGFQKRLKLENGYKQLIYTDDSIFDIALNVGYQNSQSFTKAFTAKYNISPYLARKQKEIVFSKFILANKALNPAIEHEVVYKNEVEISSKIIITNDYNNSQIDALWDTIEDEISSIANKNCYGIIIDQPLIANKQKCRYEAGIESKTVYDGYLQKKIFGGKYAKFIHKGCYNNIEDTYRNIYQSWLQNTPFQIDSSPIIEHYVISYLQVENKEELVTEILIPIKN